MTILFIVILRIGLAYYFDESSRGEINWSNLSSNLVVKNFHGQLLLKSKGDRGDSDYSNSIELERLNRFHGLGWIINSATDDRPVSLRIWTFLTNHGMVIALRRVRVKMLWIRLNRVCGAAVLQIETVSWLWMALALLNLLSKVILKTIGKRFELDEGSKTFVSSMLDLRFSR